MTIAAGTLVLGLFTIGTLRVIEARHSHDGLPGGGPGPVEEASFVIDKTKVTLQRIADELVGHKRYLKVETGSGQKIRRELTVDPGGMTHFDICETELGDLALLNTSGQSERDQVYLVRVGEAARIVKSQITQVRCRRSIGTFDVGPDRQLAFQSAIAD
jgi:hypothetical protein